MSRIRKETNSRRRTWVFIFVAVSVFVVIFFSARGRFAPVVASPAVVSALAPFQRAVNWASDRINEAGTMVWNIANVYHQNQALLEEVIALRVQNLQAEEYAAENIRLREMLKYTQSAKQFDLMAAQVIGRESTTWTSVIIVNRGSEDGISKNMPVVTERGLVGVVSEVSLTASKVQLILDPRSAVGTLVQRPASRVAGIVQGNYDDVYMPKMVNIPRNADIVEGDTIVTSGFGGIFPKGLMVGTVTNVKHDGGGLLEVAYIEPAVNFQKLEDVMIITASREAPPSPLTPPAQTPGTETDKNGNPLKGEGSK